MSDNNVYRNEDYRISALVIDSDKIYLSPTNSMGLNNEVMMDWEDDIMSAHADVVCHNQGDILEIGFGMGISADYIQGYTPSSHTIVEIHPQIIPLAQAWAVGKPNVTIIEGDWIDVVDTLDTYDGVLFDTFLDINDYDFNTKYIQNLMKPGGKYTYYNNPINIDNDIYNIGATFTPISVNPATNSYFTSSTYYVPTVQY